MLPFLINENSNLPKEQAEMELRNLVMKNTNDQNVYIKYNRKEKFDINDLYKCDNKNKLKNMTNYDKIDMMIGELSNRDLKI